MPAWRPVGVPSPEEGSVNPEQFARKAASNGPTIYAKLMNFALAEPRRVIYNQIEKEVSGFTGDLAEQMAEQLQQAYIAGVRDGYAEAIRKDEAA